MPANASPADGRMLAPVNAPRATSSDKQAMLSTSGAVQLRAKRR